VQVWRGTAVLHGHRARVSVVRLPLGYPYLGAAAHCQFRLRAGAADASAHFPQAQAFTAHLLSTKFPKLPQQLLLGDPPEVQILLVYLNFSLQEHLAEF